MRDDTASLYATIFALKKLVMVSRGPSGNWINLTPDELFHAYSALTPMLPNDVSLWGLNLVAQFRDALSYELQEAITADTLFHMPLLSSLTTRTLQLEALRSLRTCAVRQHLLILKQEKIVHRVLNRTHKHHKPPTLSAPFSANAPGDSSVPPPHDLTGPPEDVSTLATVLTSPAETTMNKYKLSDSSEPVFPIDPATNYQSNFPLGFDGCMVCGHTEHKFRTCPRHDEPGASRIFFKELFAHKPHCRKKPVDPADILPSRTAAATQSFTTPAHTTLSIDSDQHSTGPSPKKPKLAVRFLVVQVKSLSTNVTPLPLMPIAIDNGLPSISFLLGNDGSASLPMLFVTASDVLIYL
jgi:hypothetical protein